MTTHTESEMSAPQMVERTRYQLSLDTSGESKNTGTWSIVACFTQVISCK